MKPKLNVKLFVCSFLMLVEASPYPHNRGSFDEVLHALRRDPNLSAKSNWWTLEELRCKLQAYYHDLGQELTSNTLIKPSEYQGGPLLSTDSVIVVTMASAQNAERHRGITRTWGSAFRHLFLFAEEGGSEGLITLPELQGITTYEGAQHRQMRGLQWLYHEKHSTMQKAEWVFLVDDDSWVNVPMLLHTFSQLDSALPIVVGFLIGGFDVYEPRFQGGGGMLMSKAAAMQIAPNLYGSCSVLDFNDVTVAQCVDQLGIIKVHSNLFDGQFRGSADAAFNIYGFVDMITVHNVYHLDSQHRMSCLTAARYNFSYFPDFCGAPLEF